MNIDFINIANISPLPNCMCLLFNSNKTMSLAMMSLDTKYNNIISKILNNPEYFSAKFGSMKTLTIQEDNEIKNIILIGLGDEKDLDENKVENLGAKIALHAIKIKAFDVSIFLDNKFNNIEITEIAASLAFGATMAQYNFDKYKAVKAVKLKKLDLMLQDYNEAAVLYNSSHKFIADGIEVARDVVNEPSNILYPESYAQKILEVFKDTKVKVRVLGESDMEELGMNAILAVGKGSAKESKLVVMEYHGKSADSSPLVFVGKGVTFDTGGICIKPSSGMWKMKYDMGGSASVFGLMRTLALRGAKVNAVGILALVENMPGGNAQNPGDIIKTMSGQTVEVLDTDAEGRLILADALWYAAKNYNPELMVDLATLTGAITIALGSSYAGLFSNNEALIAQLLSAGKSSGEYLWNMPMNKDFIDMMKSDWADLANISNQRVLAGSSTAAAFLEKFTNNIPWAHLDIAGMAWQETAKNSLHPKGATGFGVKLLNQFIKNYYE